MRTCMTFPRGLKHSLWHVTKRQQRFVVYNDAPIQKLERASRHDVCYKRQDPTMSWGFFAIAKFQPQVGLTYFAIATYSTLTRRPCLSNNQAILNIKAGGSRASSAIPIMFRTTLAHVTRWVKSGFKSQLRNHRIADINVENERQSWSTFHFFSSRGAESSIKPKGLERPKLPTVRCDNKRYPSHCACSRLSAKSPGTALNLGTCRYIRSQMTDPSKRRIPPPDLKSERLCTSSSGVRLANTHIKDTESIQHIVQANSSTSVEGARPQSKVHSLGPNPPRIPVMHKFWSHRMYKTPDGNDISVHYCKTLESAESVAKHFLDDEILGFDVEWKANVSAADTIQNNVSLIQLASPTRIALFHIAMFKPAKAIEDLTPPTLKRILESPHIRKVGVSIKADCTRLRKFLKIDTRGIFELSHLYKLVKYCQTNPELINKRLVNLSTQVEDHFGLPLAKDAEVRCSDWASSLNYSQVQYAASDPYACLRLFNTMDEKRVALDPIPPLPANAELNLPIKIVHKTTVNIEPQDVEVTDPKISQSK